MDHPREHLQLDPPPPSPAVIGEILGIHVLACRIMAQALAVARGNDGDPDVLVAQAMHQAHAQYHSMSPQEWATLSKKLINLVILTRNNP